MQVIGVNALHRVIVDGLGGNPHLGRVLTAAGDVLLGPVYAYSEVVRAGIRLLMERDGARRFYALKADLEHAMRDAETGAFADFDPRAYEPDAYRSWTWDMTIRLSCLARRDLDDIRRHTLEAWGRAQCLKYYREG